MRWIYECQACPLGPCRTGYSGNPDPLPIYCTRDREISHWTLIKMIRTVSGVTHINLTHMEVS